MFSDMLAEIRKYGESLIIVDQIPNKLTPDVLKNTNTKIIHRIFAADDKEAVGNTVMLKDEQKEFLSNLPAGRAVYFTNSTEKAIQVQIRQATDTSEFSPSDEKIQCSVIQYYLDNYKRGLYMGLELFDEKPDMQQFECIKELNSGLVNCWERNLSINKGNLSADVKNDIIRVAEIIGYDRLGNYINNYGNSTAIRNYYIANILK